MKKLKKIIPSLLFFLLTTVIISPVLAQSTNLGAGTEFGSAFRSIFSIIVGLAGIIFVVLFLVGGIMYLTSAGNEESSKKAKTLLVDAVIGLAIVSIAYAAGIWLIDKLGGVGQFKTVI